MYRKQLQRLDLTHCFFSMSPADILIFKLAYKMAINGLKNEKTLFFLSKRNIMNKFTAFYERIPIHHNLITNMRAFITRQNLGSSNRIKFCECCLHGFSSETRLNQHLKLCGEHDVILIKVPPINSQNISNTCLSLRRLNIRRNRSSLSKAGVLQT